jgi:NADH dehydrogenase (ubiquinone) 1 alpha subcomplex subunit 9
MVLLMQNGCRNFTFDAVHVEGAARIARVAKALNVPRLVHVSHLNASHDSSSQFYASKARGEEAVKAEFPEVTIIRPGALFGYEDKLLNNIASML